MHDSGFFAQASNALGVAGLVLWVWMLVHCIRRDSDRRTWLWLLIFLNIPGAILYFFMSYLPQRRAAPPQLFGRWRRRREIWQAEMAARHIGNAHQYVELGEILFETGQLARAAEAYDQAIERDPSNLPALWGAALVDMRLKRFDRARERLQSVMAVDPGYKLGRASMAYGQALIGLDDLDGAKAHFELHLQRRDDSEVRLQLATVLEKLGDVEGARALLGPLVEDLKASRNGRLRRIARHAQRLLKKLG